jgi:hypothetical protein
MFGPFKKKEDLKQVAANALLTNMTTYGPDSADYLRNLEYLERIEALKTKNRRPKLSPDQIALVAGNLAGILIIVAYEQKHVFGSRAQNSLLKPK